MSYRCLTIPKKKKFNLIEIHSLALTVREKFHSRRLVNSCGGRCYGNLIAFTTSKRSRKSITKIWIPERMTNFWMQKRCAKCNTSTTTTTIYGKKPRKIVKRNRMCVASSTDPYYLCRTLMPICPMSMPLPLYIAHDIRCVCVCISFSHPKTNATCRYQLHGRTSRVNAGPVYYIIARGM